MASIRAKMYRVFDSNSHELIHDLSFGQLTKLFDSNDLSFVFSFYYNINNIDYLPSSLAHIELKIACFFHILRFHHFVIYPWTLLFPTALKILTNI